MGRAKRHGGEDADPPPGPPPAPPVDPILAGIFANNPLGNQCPGENCWFYEFFEMFLMFLILAGGLEPWNSMTFHMLGIS